MLLLSYRPVPAGFDSHLTDRFLESGFELVKPNEIWQKMAQDYWTFTIINADPIHRILMIYNFLDKHPFFETETQKYYKMNPGNFYLFLRSFL